MSARTSRSDGKPRGIVSVSERVMAASRLVEEGTSCAEVARLYGVKVTTIHAWRKRVLDAQADARLLKGMAKP
jgi:transposase